MVEKLKQGFPIELDVSPVPGTEDFWKINKNFVYISKAGTGIIVQRDFVTNFATVPRIFRNIVQPWGKHGKAAVIHDFCYFKRIYTRKRCDKLFLEAMEFSGVGYFKRHFMYRMVRLFGGSHYGEK